jgi:hypothetical protein
MVPVRDSRPPHFSASGKSRLHHVFTHSSEAFETIRWIVEGELGKPLEALFAASALPRMNLRRRRVGPADDGECSIDPSQPA